MSNINFFRVMAGNGSNFNSQDIPCNAGGINFTGFDGVFYATAVVLGTGIGPITASFNAQSVPDRFRLEWSGSTVADSLFVGDALNNQSSYNTYTGSIIPVTALTRSNWNQQADTFQPANVESVSYTTASFVPFPNSILTRGNYNVAVGERVNGAGNHGGQKGVLNYFPQFSSSAADGNVKLCFFKHTQEPTTFQIIIDGPDDNTAWNLFSLSCPGNDTSLHSSSIMDKDGDTAIIYHTAPSFDLDIGMTLYENSALTTKFTSGGSYSTSSFWGSDKSMLVSGSTIQGTQYPFNGGSGICFKSALNTGYSYITLADDGVITARSCTTTKFPSADLRPISGTLPVTKPALGCSETFINLKYHDGDQISPTIGDKIYNTNSTSSPVGADNWPLGFEGLSINVYTTDSTGEITSVYSCI